MLKQFKGLLTAAIKNLFCQPSFIVQIIFYFEKIVFGHRSTLKSNKRFPVLQLRNNLFVVRQLLHKNLEFVDFNIWTYKGLWLEMT